MKKASWARRNVITLAIIMSFVLYFTGVISGLYANKLTEERTASSIYSLKNETKQNIQTLEQGTQNQITELHNYIAFLDTNLKTMQLQQLFTSTLPPDKACKAQAISSRYLIQQLEYYRQRLPFRLEAFERANEPTQEYMLLKQQYNTRSLQTWIFTKNENTACNKTPVSVLYYYSKSCANCVAQGEELDTFAENLTLQGKAIAVFTVDFEADDNINAFVKEFYGVNAVPAIIINDRVLQGRLYRTDELLHSVP